MGLGEGVRERKRVELLAGLGRTGRQVFQDPCSGNTTLLPEPSVSNSGPSEAENEANVQRIGEPLVHPPWFITFSMY
jgi:hypothetical protein